MRRRWGRRFCRIESVVEEEESVVVVVDTVVWCEVRWC